jgi:uncharacterized membrane protein
MIPILTLTFLFTPILIIYLTERYRWVNKIGAIIIAYALGLILGHIGILPKSNEFLIEAINLGANINKDTLQEWLLNGKISQTDILAYKVYNLQDILSSITIPLSLPLLLFSLKIKTWFRMSGKTMLSMMLALVAVVFFIILGHSIFRNDLNESNKIAGMLVGLYTGGTPNLASLKQLLGVDTETYIMTHTYDTAVGVVYLFFIITIGKKIFRKFLLPYPTIKNEEVYDKISFTENAYQGIMRKPVLIGLAKVLGITTLIVGISVGLGVIFKDQFMLVVILSITTLGIISSFVPFINNTVKSFELGMYFITVFSFVIASMADVTRLINISSSLIGYITLVYVGALFTHTFLCKVFKVDSDTLMITSVALLCSPPFVPMVAGTLKNKEVIVSGLTVGIMGYAIGNYLGALIANIL